MNIVQCNNDIKVKIGLIGAGKVAQEIHLPVLKNVRGAEIAWMCDLSLDAARSARDAYFPNAAAHTSLDECDGVDIALVTVPVGLRRTPLLKAIARQWNVLCEKPFASTVDEHDDYLRRAADAGVSIGVGLMRRYYKPTLITRAILRSGVLGPVKEVWASQGSKVIRTGRADNYQADKQSAGGGVLMETGVHLVDQVFTILDVQSSFIIDATQKMFNGLDFDTRVSAELGLASAGKVSFNLKLSNLRDLYFGIVIRTANAVVKVGLFAESRVTLCTHDGKAISTLHGQSGADKVYQAFFLEWQDFIHQCHSRNDYKSVISAETARPTTEFIEHTYQTSRKMSLGVIAGADR